MKNNILETLVGGMVIIVTVFFIVFAYNSNKNNLNVTDGYILKARFQNIDGVTQGSSLMVAGIKIGTVESIELDTKDFIALVSLRVQNHIKLPKDSQAMIVTSGLIGNKYIAITPGEDEECFENGAQIKYTQSSINIESIIGKIMYSIGNK